MKKYFMLLVLLLLGCAQQMPKANYEGFGTLFVKTHHCFQSGFINGVMYANGIQAIRYNLNTWSYDSNALNKLIAEYSNRFEPDKVQCHYVTGQLYMQINSMKSHMAKKKQDQEQWDRLNNSLQTNKPVYCNTIGTMTTCF